MLFVGLADRVAEAAEQGPLQVRGVDHQAPPRPRDPGQLVREGTLVRDVLEHVDDGHAVEGGARERQAVPAHEVDVGLHEAADRRDRLLRQVARGPASAPLAQEQAHDPVVGAQVEAAQARGRSQQARGLGELPLLQDRLAEQGHRPLAVSHGAPAAR